MLLRSSPFCYAKGATPVAGQSPFHGVHWYGMRASLSCFLHIDIGIPSFSLGQTVANILFFHPPAAPSESLGTPCRTALAANHSTHDRSAFSLPDDGPDQGI